MKFFAVFVLVAFVASVSAGESTEDNLDKIIAGLDKFPEGGPELDALLDGHKLTELEETSLSMPPPANANYLINLFGIPSCKLGARIGNPICFGKCVSRGHAGGVCKGKTCVCVG